MGMRLQKIGHALTPRALEHWQRNLGAGARFWIQGLQIKKEYHLAARHEARVNELEDQILRLQSGTCLSLQEMHENLFKRSPIPHWLLDTNGIFVDVNQSTLTFFGYSREEMVGNMSVFDLLLPDEVKGAQENYAKRLEGVPEAALLPKKAPRRYRLKEGTVVFGETSNAFIRNGGGRVKYVLTSFVDVTARVRLEATQKEAAERKRQVELSGLINLISHKLRQLLVVAGTNSEAMQRHLAELQILAEVSSAAARIKLPLDLPGIREKIAEIEEKLTACERSIRGMERTVGRFSSSADALKENFNALRVAAEVVAGLKGEAKKYNCVIELKLENLSEEDGIFADVSGFMDLLNTLIINAAQAYPAADASAESRKINVNIFKNRLGDSIIIVVNDKGVGMNPVLAGGLFKDRVPTTKPGGHGLGLFGVRKFVDASGGKVHPVVSSPGKGSTFTIELPRVHFDRKAPQKTALFLSPQTKQKLSAVKVFLIDDEPEVLESFADNLKDMGFTVTTFSDPTEAIARYQRLPEKPQLVITDLTMPQMQGDDLISRIKSLSSSTNTKFILCTGKALDPTRANDPLTAFIKTHDVGTLVKGAAMSHFRDVVLTEAERILGVSLSADRQQELIKYEPYLSSLRSSVALIGDMLNEFGAWADLHFNDPNLERRYVPQLFEAYIALIDEINRLTASPESGEGKRLGPAVIFGIYCERLLKFKEPLVALMNQAAGGIIPIEEISRLIDSLQRHHKALLLAKDAPQEETEKIIQIYDLLLSLEAKPS